MPSTNSPIQQLAALLAQPVAMTAPTVESAPNPYDYLPPDDWVGRVFRAIKPGNGNFPMPLAQVPAPNAPGREFTNETWGYNPSRGA